MATESNRKSKSGTILIKEGIRDYSTDPFVVKKVEKANAFLAKNGLPKFSSKKK